MSETGLGKTSCREMVWPSQGDTPYHHFQWAWRAQQLTMATMMPLTLRWFGWQRLLMPGPWLAGTAAAAVPECAAGASAASAALPASAALQMPACVLVAAAAAAHSSCSTARLSWGRAWRWCCCCCGNAPAAVEAVAWNRLQAGQCLMPGWMCRNVVLQHALSFPNLP